jgi:hypothetical protein
MARCDGTCAGAASSAVIWLRPQPTTRFHSRCEYLPRVPGVTPHRPVVCRSVCSCTSLLSSASAADSSTEPVALDLPSELSPVSNISAAGCAGRAQEEPHVGQAGRVAAAEQRGRPPVRALQADGAAAWAPEDISPRRRVCDRGQGCCVRLIIRQTVPLPSVGAGRMRSSHTRTSTACVGQH